MSGDSMRLADAEISAVDVQAGGLAVSPIRFAIEVDNEGGGVELIFFGHAADTTVRLSAFDARCLCDSLNRAVGDAP